MLYQILIPIYLLLEVVVNKFALIFRKYQWCRNIGIAVFNRHPTRSFVQGFLKLFMESYFEVIICLALNLYAIINYKNPVQGFFNNSNNITCSLFTIFYSLLAIIFPVWGTIFLVRNFDNLHLNSIKLDYNFLFSDLKLKHLRQVLFHMLFLLRRLATMSVLVLLSDFPYFQIVILLVLSQIQMMYLLDCSPLATKKQNKIVFFNEISTYLVIHISFHFLNPIMDNVLKQSLGWLIIGLISLNILVNLIFVVSNFILEQ